ncbi:3-hydroxyacyl-CoA dehydrogenase [Psychrobacter sp. PL15]|uniref:3-hydroxyacyl-CoA dehydrogenase NAD-binding domain-containing protein n=1 Tax=Psychrobacter sp. PL15 TaxID=3071719 RepID=UPI002E037150|nr:3-hydroxyacyl-CoA dehydrogenase [Psychrobacter sp. PL15]
MSIINIGVIGAGQISLGIAQAFATSGFQVILNEIDALTLDRGLQSISSSSARLNTKGSLTSNPT